MKKILLIALMALVPLLEAHGDYRHAYHDGCRDASHHSSKVRYLPVVRSEPIYEDVVTYRRCDTEARHHHGALLGGVIGGIIGHHMDTRHRAPATLGGAVAGAIIGSRLAQIPHGEAAQCRRVETQLVGYRNIAYWRGERVIKRSERPLRRIRLPKQQRR